MKQLHPLQLKMLKKLLFAPQMKYTELKPEEHIENNQFSFHLNALITMGYIKKIDPYYILTTQGKEYANRMDAGELQIQLQAKVGVLVCATRGQGDSQEYLIYTRKKHPFFGKQGFITWKAKIGEALADVAQRELLEEAHLLGTPQLVHIKHSFVYEKGSHKLLEDKFFYFFLVQNPQGTAQGSEEGPVERIARKEFSKKITSIYYDFPDIMVIIDSLSTPNRPLTFEEKSYEVEDF